MSRFLVFPELVDIDSIRPSTYNPRTVHNERLDIIRLSLQKLGFLIPIYTDKFGEIISGHQRHLVSKEMGVKRVPVCFMGDLSLDARKSVNILFNRGTNDMELGDTPTTLTTKLTKSGLVTLANKLGDIQPDSAQFYRCMEAKQLPLKPFLDANTGKWRNYPRMVARSLYTKSVVMPIIVTKDLNVVNGIGRLQFLAEKKLTEGSFITISKKEALFANAVLNYLSMDFDIHNRYRDLLRYNSFRRPRDKRLKLGRGKTFYLLGRSKAAHNFDVNSPKHWARFKAKYGETVLDFGAGLLDEYQIMTRGGIDCTPFEPFLLNASREIDPPGARKLTKKFLTAVSTSKKWDSIFLSAILNSVPFEKDREHIITILGALAYPNSIVYASSQSIGSQGWQKVIGNDLVNLRDLNMGGFILDYEPRITLAGFGSFDKHKPKVQKYFLLDEFQDMFLKRFSKSEATIVSNNIYLIAYDSRKPVKKDLVEAIEFEFDLPYPDNKRLGLVDEAMKAFQKRMQNLGVDF